MIHEKLEERIIFLTCFDCVFNVCINIHFSESEEELVERPGSVMSRRPEPEKPIIKKRKRPGKQIRMLQEKHKNKIKVRKIQKV